MRIFRQSRIMERAAELASKIILLAVAALFCLWMISGARAASLQITDLKAHERADGTSRVELVFSEAVDKNSVQMEFQRNFIQLSLKNVSAFPAKNENVRGGSLDKIFTYQYQPDLARARILLKGDAAKVKSGSTLSIDGNKVVIEVGAFGKLAAQKARDSVKNRAAANEKTETAKNGAGGEIAAQAAEDKIVKEILSDSSAVSAAKTPAAAATPGKSKEDEPLFASSGEKEMKAGAQPAKSGTPLQKIITALMTVLGILAAVALGFRKFVLGKGINFQKQGEVIDVVSSRMIGAKKSVSLIKVADQYLVIGVAGDNINLLANLGANVNIDKQVDEAQSGGGFTSALQKKMDGRADQEDDPELGYVNKLGGIRSAIKKRMEGLKPLG